MSPFSHSVQRRGDEVVLRFTGELDESAAAAGRAAIDEALAGSARRLLVDLSALEFMDSTGIWLLVDAQRRALQAGAELHLAGGEPPAIAHTLELSGVDELLGHPDPAPGAPGAEPVQLRLYVSSRSAVTGPAVEAVRAIGARLRSVELEVIDVLEEPERAEADRVIATPTLVKVQPGPPLRLIGAIGDGDAVLRHLGLDHLAA